MNVLALPGSLRRGSWNRMLLQAAAARASNGLRVVVYDAMAAIPLFNEDLEQGVSEPEEVARLRERVRAADGLLIATPEYNQSIPGVLKNAIDWLSRPAPDEVLVGKPVAIAGASSGRWGTRLAQSALRQVLYATEALVIAQPGLYIREAAQVFDSSGRITDAAIGATLDAVLSALAGSIRSRRGVEQSAGAIV